MTKRKSLLTRCMALTLIISNPIAQAQSMLPSGMDFNLGTGGLGSERAIWDYMADKAYEPREQVDFVEHEQLATIYFADYLGYINAIGLELAATENEIHALKDIKVRGECTKETLDSYTKILESSVEADLDTFTNNYCNNPCRVQAELTFNLISTYAQPEGLPETCADRARQMYKTYRCEGLEAPGIGGGFPDPLDSMKLLPSHSSWSSEFNSFDELSLGFDLFQSMNRMSLDPSVLPGHAGSQLIDFSSIGKGGVARIDPTLPGRGPVGIKIPGQGDLTSSRSPDQDFKNLVGKKKAECVRENAAKLRQTFGAPESVTTSLGAVTPVRDPMDPRWTTRLPERENEKVKNDKLDPPENPVCKSSGIGGPGHYDKLRAAYNEISYRKIGELLGHWPILDDSDNLEEEALRLILGPADRFFHGFLSELQRMNREICGTSSGAMISDMSYGTEIDGRTYTVTIRETPAKSQKPADSKTDTKPVEDQKKLSEPVTVATYFSSNRSLIESFINGAIGADTAGAGTHTESRAGEITAGVLDGTVSPDEIDEEAGKGALGQNGKEIAELVRKNLSQGNYRGFAVLAASLFGGSVSGASGGAAAKLGIVIGKKIGEKITVSTASGRMSAILEGTKRILMMPFLEGAETGAIGSKFLAADELMRRLNVTKPGFHKAKQEILKDFPKLKKLGFLNPDIGINGLGHIMFKDPRTGRIFETDVPFKNFIFLD